MPTPHAHDDTPFWQRLRIIPLLAPCSAAHVPTAQYSGND